MEVNKDVSEENIFLNEDIELPILLPDDNTLYRQFAGKNIAIKDGKIIAYSPSLRKLHKILEKLLPKDEGCHIKYIEEQVHIYGFNL